MCRCTPAHTATAPQRIHRPDSFESLTGPFRRGQGPVLVVVGDAGGMTPAASERAMAFVDRCLVPAVVATGAIVITGGTDAGVMSLVGLARCRAQAAFPLIGVAPAGCVAVDLDPRAGMAAPERHHSALVLVAGDRFGAECEPMMALARHIAGECPVLVLVIGGGTVTRKDVEAALAEGHLIAAMSASGGVASSLIAASGAVDEGDARYREWAKVTLQQRRVLAVAASTKAERLVRLLTGAPEIS